VSFSDSIEKHATLSRWATTVGRVCDQFGGEVQTGPFGSQLHASDYVDEGTPVVMPQGMQDGRIVCDRIARVGPKHVSQLKRHTLQVGDVIYSRRGDVTRFAVVSETEAGWLCGTGSIRIRLNSRDIDIRYVRR
jgi:type I restriction enzyme, S subunit